MDALLSTGRAARACGVSPQTVNRWVDEGLVQGMRIMGSAPPPRGHQRPRAPGGRGEDRPRLVEGNPSKF